MSDEQKIAQGEQLAVVDDPRAPIVYVDGCIGGGGGSANLTLTFAARAVDHSGGAPRPYLLTNLRLMIPADAAKGLADFINGMLADAQPARSEDAAAGRSIQ